MDGSVNSVIVIIITDGTKIIRCEPLWGISFLFLLGSLLMLLRLNIFCISIFVIVSRCHISIESGHVRHSLFQNCEICQSRFETKILSLLYYRKSCFASVEGR